MKWIYFITFLLFLQCASEEIKEKSKLEDTSYEIKFSPCICKRQDMIVQAKKTIVTQGVKDYQDFTEKVIPPEIKSEIIEEGYEHFLYDFSLNEKPESKSLDEPITAQGKVKQNDLDQFVEMKATEKRYKPKSSSPDYGSKGLEAIKAFQSNRKKRQTIEEISKTKPITLYDIKRR